MGMEGREGSALADALWACVLPDCTQPLVPADVWWDYAGEQYLQGGVSTIPRAWQPWRSISDCWYAMLHFRIGVVWTRDRVGLLQDSMEFGISMPKVTIWIPSFAEADIAVAIVRLALQRWEKRHGTHSD